MQTIIMFTGVLYIQIPFFPSIWSGKMYSYFSPLSFISHLLLIINLFISLPISFGDDDPRFVNCSRGVFECGEVKNIGYPFWGNGRAEYCGHPDFELKCEEDDVIQIVIQGQNYRVLNIFENNHTLRMRTMNPFNNNNCPARLANISLPNNLFNYSAPFNQNITLFYDCPSPIPLLTSNTIPCLTNDRNTSYYSFDYLNIGLPRDVWSCGTVVKVPILQAIVTTYTELLRSMEDGFDATYVVVANNSDCIQCENTRGQCGYNRGMQPTCFCFDGQYQGNCTTKKPSARKKIVIVSGAVFGGCFFGILMLIFWWKMDLSSTDPIMFWKRKKKAQMMVENYLKSFGSLAPKRYNYSDIKRITSSFKHKIGQGGFGVVYKGKLLDGCVVAVKVLNKTKGNGEEFINEIASITRTSHVNVVSLFGYCFDGSRTALIYEFMANGSLEKFIYDPNSLEAQSHLGWDVLYNIAAGVARGLEYLHRGCNTRILHFDIKPHNILLDEEFCPKISDFGLAKLCPRKESIISMLGTRGTAGYIAPEVFSRHFGGVSHKSDVYSYGMMVLEIVGRRKNLNEGVNHSSEMYFPHWIYKRLELDEDIHGNMSKEEGEITRKMVLVALWCIQTNPIDRPAMSRVVEMLEGRTDFLSIPPKPYLCSPPRSPVRSSTTTL